MPYIINNTRGQVVAVIPDGTTNTTSTSLSLLGKNVTPYGEIEIENLVKHLENFANSTSPNHPVVGQVWYDTTDSVVKVYTGNQWKKVSGMTVNSSAPTVDVKEGDLWLDTVHKQLKIYSTTDTGFEWINNNRVIRLATAPDPGLGGDMYFNTTSNQLFISDGASWSLIGPPAVPAFANTQWDSLSIRDLNGIAKPVIRGTVDGTPIAFVSKENFTIYPDDRLNIASGFTDLFKGITVSNTSIFSGLASSATVLSPGAMINGQLFDGSTDITVTTQHNLNPGSYISGSTFNGSSESTWAVDANSLNTPSSIVARDADGNFAASTISANLVGDVVGLATNISGILATDHGGTGTTFYGPGEILIGDSFGTLTKGSVLGQGSISVAKVGNDLKISYTGGTGTGNVTSVGITPGDGITVSGSPVTGSGTITVGNTGVLKIIAGNGISIDRQNGNVTISVTGAGGGGNTAVGGDVFKAGNQTFTGRNFFQGNLVSPKYYMSDTPSHISGIYYESTTTAVKIAVDNEFRHNFFKNKLVVEGISDSTGTGLEGWGGSIVGIDNGVTGGSGVLGVHTNAITGWGVGVAAYASHSNFTGAIIQGSSAKNKSGTFVQFRSYSGGDNVFQVDGAGNVTYDGIASTPAGDYAEYFEWADGNPHNEDRRGRSVTLVGNKIKLAEEGDVLIGVVSVKPSIVGDAAEVMWANQYLKDEWGVEIQEPYHIFTWIDADGKHQSIASYDITPNTVIPSDAVRSNYDSNGNALMTPKKNPSWDPSVEYVPRSKRKEWSAIGMLGKLRLLNGQPVASSWVKLRDINDRISEWLVR